MTTPQHAAPRVEDLLEENRRLREQLDQKTRVAAKALAAQQRRMLEMEEYAAELAAANERVGQVNERLAAALRVLEEKDRRITDDLQQARSFQRRILTPAPASEWARFAVEYRPADVVGGDLYSVSPLDDGWRVFVADAIGHGVPAALRTMILKAEYDRAKGAPTPDAVLRALNRQLVAMFPGFELHCSAACVDVRREGRGARVTYATAAHPPLVHVTGREARQVYQPAAFLGVLPNMEYPSTELVVTPGERLFLYSDGLVEEWVDGEVFGPERVECALARPDLALDAVVREAVAALEAFAGARDVSDDVTLVGVEVA